MLVRNFLVPNLTIKAGRQLVVWGNHRMFGHFDWNNVGWAHDGLTANYKLSKSTNLQVGWLRTAERNCGGPATGNCIGNVRPGGKDTPVIQMRSNDGNVVYVRAPMKVAGVVLEPTYIWHDGGTGGGPTYMEQVGSRCHSSYQPKPGILSAAGPSRSSLREAPGWT